MKLQRMTRPLSSALAAIALVSRVSVSQTPTVPARPTPGPIKGFVFPKITTLTLSNGLQLAVVENHELPIVAVRVGFLGSAFLDPPGKEGAWVLMMSAMREGTSSRSASAISDAAADLGTTILSSSPVVSLASMSFTTVTSAWRPALDLLADIVIHPSFPVNGLKRLQGVQAASARPAPGPLAFRILSTKLFGSDHPYARFPIDSSVRRITRDDLIALHTMYLRPQNSVVVVAGDITPAKARAEVEKAFGSWERAASSIASKYLVPSAQPTPTTIYLQDLPGSTQSFIYSGQIAPSRGSVDAAAVEAVDAILGGNSAGSRLYDAFRTTHGLSYNPATSIQWRPEPQAATWSSVTTVPAGKTDTAVMELVRVVRETRGDRPLTASELDFSRKNLVRNLPAQLETVDALATRTLIVLQNRLPVAFYNDYVTRMNSLTLADVQSAARKYLDPDHLVIAIVGDRAKLEAPLRATGIPVVIVDH